MKFFNKKLMIIVVLTFVAFLLGACRNDGDAETSKLPETPPTKSQQQEVVPGTQGTTGGQTSGQEGSPYATDDIGIENIQAIVLAKVPGATSSDIYDLEKEYDDGRLTYEGSIYYGGYEYEFEVDAATGNILKWEIDD